MNPFADLTQGIAGVVAKQLARYVLERLAFPKRPERTPRRLKKAAREAMKRQMSHPQPKGTRMTQESLLTTCKTALDQIAEIIGPGETITDLDVLVSGVRCLAVFSTHQIADPDSPGLMLPCSERVAELLTLAAQDVVAERRRQINVEGWTPEHDARHAPGQLALAAAAYAIEAEANLTDPEDSHPIGAPPECWPWGGQWWKPTDARRDLVKAAALLLAEIERLDRKA